MAKKTVAQLDGEMQEFRSEFQAGFDELKQLILSANGNGQVVTKSTRKEANAKNGKGKQPFIRTQFIPSGGKLRQVVDLVNDMQVGEVVKFPSAQTYSAINKLWTANRYDWGKWDVKTRSRIHTRKPDSPDAVTYDDGASFRAHKAKSITMDNGRKKYDGPFTIERLS